MRKGLICRFLELVVGGVRADRHGLSVNMALPLVLLDGFGGRGSSGLLPAGREPPNISGEGAAAGGASGGEPVLVLTGERGLTDRPKGEQVGNVGGVGHCVSV